MNLAEIRSMNCEFGSLSRPDGSAIFTLGMSLTLRNFENQAALLLKLIQASKLILSGDTVALSAVYGPVEVKPQKLLIESATIEVLYKPRIGVADKLKEATLTNIFKTAILSSQHPRTSIAIIVQEMQDSGGLLACAINSACLALINAGIPLKFLVAAISCMINNQNQIILDPNLILLKESKAIFTLVFDSVNKNIVASETSGTFSTTEFEEVLSSCREASTHVFEFYYNVVKKSMIDSVNDCQKFSK